MATEATKDATTTATGGGTKPPKKTARVREGASQKSKHLCQAITQQPTIYSNQKLID